MMRKKIKLGTSNNDKERELIALTKKIERLECENTLLKTKLYDISKCCNINLYKDV